MKYLCDLLKQEGYGVVLTHVPDKTDFVELEIDGKIIFTDSN